jgi:molybdopterin molybdotransferase
VRVTEALHRVLLEDFPAPSDLPRFDDSQMDGFAVSSAATPGTFDVVGMHPAGHQGEAVSAGEATAIMTGAPVPPGADAVVPVEATDGFDAPTIRLDAVPAGQFVRHRGSDIREGDRALVADAPLTAASLGVLAAFGLTEVQVRARPRVLIVAGGDEVAAPGETLGPGQLYDANTALLTAVLRSAGAAVVDSLVVSDTVEDFRVALSERVRAVDPDLVVTSGGISAGRFEVVQQSLSQDADLDGYTPLVGFGSIAMQPGGPQGAGVLRCEEGNSVPIVCFPGNPVSTWISAHVLLRDALSRAWSTCAPARRVTAALVEEITPLPTRTQMRRARLDAGPADEAGSADDVALAAPSAVLRVRALAGTSSHLLATAARADCLIVVPPGDRPLPAGTPLEVVLL